MQRIIEFEKAKLDKDNNLSVEYTERLKDGSSASVKADCTAPIHADLREAFGNLDKHLAALCEQYGKDGKVSDKVRCRSVSLKGEDENEGLVLSGKREVAVGNQSFALNTPFIRFGRDSDNYAEMDGLNNDIDVLIDQLNEYVVNGKHAPDPQQELFPEPATAEA